MTDTRTKILDEIACLWNKPPDERKVGTKDIQYFRDWQIEPDDVLRRLRATFSESEIEAAVTSAVEVVIATYERGAVPDKRSTFLAGCCLSLATAENGVSLTKAMARAAVRSLASVYWYQPVGDLVRKQLNAADVLEALLSGLRKGCDTVRMSCLEGLRLYRGIAKKPVEPNRLGELAIEVQRVVETLKTHESPMVREAARQSSVSDWLK
jgi:hypothetical protein